MGRGEGFEKMLIRQAKEGVDRVRNYWGKDGKAVLGEAVRKLRLGRMTNADGFGSHHEELIEPVREVGKDLIQPDDLGCQFHRR